MNQPHPDLERRYRRLLRAYPGSYRRRRGGEMLETLLASSRPGQRRPGRREATVLLLEGLRVRAATAGHLPRADLWLGGLYLAVVLLLVRDGYAPTTSAVMVWPDYHALLRAALRGDPGSLPQLADYLVGGALAVTAVVTILRCRLAWTAAAVVVATGLEIGPHSSISPSSVSPRPPAWW